jgi:hypothetical protein
MNQSHLRLKAVADRLADLLGTEEGALLLELITKLSEPEPSAPDEPSWRAGTRAAKGDEPQPVRVGVWEATNDNGEQVFVRQQTNEPLHLWANVQRIPPKRNKQRVVLVGESVARGYLYDPHYNPATALQEILCAATGPQGVEVIDLARTDLSLDELEKLVRESLALEPDVLVVFAGNNWHPLAIPTAGEFENLGTALREGGSWRAVRDYLEAWLTKKIEFLFQTLGGIVKDSGVPVVFVLPEFNLPDWRSECEGPLMLDADATASWQRTLKEAEELLAGNEWRRAEASGWRLLELDGGTTAAGPNLIAEVGRRQGETDKARRFLEQARDTTICWPFAMSPRCFSVSQSVIRSKAAEYGVVVVDLPRRFEEYLDGDLPGRRMFLDYCHLSFEGIKVSMACAAEPVLPLLNYPARHWRELCKTELQVTDKLAGEAHFLAAVHNANWGQGSDIVRHHCHAAIESYPQITKLMQLFLDFHARRAPSCLCKSFEEVCEMKNLAAINLLFNDSTTKKFLNTILIEELLDTLESQGVPARDRLNHLLIKEHAVSARGVSLLETAYAMRHFARSLVDSRPAAYRATSRRSIFNLVCDGSGPIHFTLTLKAPGAVADRLTHVWLNGVRLFAHDATDKWTTATFTAQAELLRPGINRLELHWPMQEWSGAEWRSRAAERLEAGKMTEVIPIYGEIHSFRASLTPTPKSQMRDSDVLAMSSAQV